MIKAFIKYSLLFSVIWTVIIFILCCTPGKYIPSNDWLDLLSFDKVVHASIFFILVFAWLLFLYHQNLFFIPNIILCLLFCVCYGGVLEIMQATVFSDRSGDWLDFIANSLGCLVGTWFTFKQVSKFKD